MKNPTAFRATVIAMLLLAGLAGAWLGARFASPPPPAAPALETGTWLAPARPLPEVSLLDQSGQPFTPGRLAGRWTLVFFGFTHCPEACPTTLAMLASLRRFLVEDGLPAAELPDVLLVSVDPERDTPEVLATYLAAFDGAFRGVTGQLDAIRTFATSLGVPFSKVFMDGGGDYMMDHSTAILLVDPDARLAAVFQAPQTTAGLGTDYRRVLAAR